MRYYIGGMACDTNYLEHHGVKGQKWGVRRYQNEDGSLTPEGQARYGDKQNYRNEGTEFVKRDGKDSKGRQLYTPGYGKGNRFGGGGGFIRGFASIGTNARGQGLAMLREDRLRRKAEKMESQGNTKKANKLKEKADAQQASRENLKQYMDHTSTGKLVAQNLLLGHRGGSAYRRARARGSNRVSAFIQSQIPITSLISNKKAYGKAIMWSAMDD